MTTSLFAKLSPDKLRDHVYDLAICATEVDRQLFIKALNQASAIAPLLRTLGFAAATVKDLTAYEIAQLVRYLKYNKPDVIPSILEALDILAPIKEKSNAKTKSRRLSTGGIPGNRAGQSG